MTTMLELKDVSAGYNGLKALFGVSIQVKATAEQTGVDHGG